MAQIPNVKKKPSTLPVLPFPFQTVRENPKAVASPPATKVAELEAWEVTGEQAAAGVVAVPRTTTRGRPGLGLGERKFMQALCDWGVVVGGLLVILTMSVRDYAPVEILTSLAAVTGLWLFFADAFNAYSAPVMQSSFRSGYTAVKVLIMVVVAYTLLAWFAGGFLPVIRPRVGETVEALLLALPLVLVRVAMSALITRAPMRRRVVVVGDNRDGWEMGEALARYDGKTYEFLGYFDDTPRNLRDFTDNPYGPRTGDREYPTLHAVHSALVWPTSELVPIHNSRGLDQVVLANPNQTPQLLQTLSLLHEGGVQITPMFALYQDLTGRVPVSHLGDDWYVALPAHVKKNARTYLLFKRICDFAMALMALVLSAPVMPLVALAIKLDSSGPIFFKQMRVGVGGRVFRIVKFRTMRQDAEKNTGAVWATDHDPRITRIGRFLRKSRLDELPQLWNVLVGDMSFVGPRPERPEFDEELEHEVPFYRARRAVRPGLTGWAQVSHGYGNTMFDALRKVEYDLYYIKNQSLYLDLMILFRTIAVVLKLGGK
jgi:exopolysaccharide biosynthesis polyprenyl glycosylphosphotransferase